MSQQSDVIFAALFIAFLAFITLRGELRKYLGFFLSTPTGGGATPTQTSDAAPSDQSNTQTALAVGEALLPLAL